MPSRTHSNGATPASQPASKLFELPVLDFKFAPLTEGTDIPPPLPSPVEEEPPRSETPPVKAASQPAGNGSANGNADGGDHEGSPASTAADSTAAAKTGTKRPADSPISPVSPTSSNRPSSIRRLFSRNLLNTTYTDGEVAHAAGSNSMEGRPQSSSNISVLTDGKRSRRSSGWFRRLRGGGGDDATPAAKRATTLFEDIKIPTPAGPPPPMIPELSDLESKIDLDTSSIGTDLFKNIK